MVGLFYTKIPLKLKGQEAKLRDFCKSTGLDSDRYREQVFAAKTERGIRNFGKSTSMKAVHSAKRHYQDFIKKYGIDEPKTLDKYYKMKYNNSPAYKIMQRYTHMVDKGEVSPIMGYKLFRDTAVTLDKTIIGVKTSNGITITGYTDHCIGRIIGRSALDNEYNRQGVTIEELIDCITNGKVGKTQANKRGEISTVLKNKDIKLSFNPNSGTIIQVSRLEW